jgi:RecJ-like exonuclease
MVIAAKGGDFKLTDYDCLMAELDAIPEGVEDFILCDLGTDPGRFDSLVKKLGRKSRRISVTYIDHHYLTEEAKAKIRKSGVRLFHNVNECSGTLTYRFLAKELPPDAQLLALYAAVTDYMDGSPTAKKIIERHDRQMVLFEATLLALAVANRGDDQEFLRMLVGELSMMKRPHTIGGVPGAALDQAEALSALSKLVAKEGKVMGKIAYMETDQHSTGSIAKLLLGAKDVPLAAAFREKRQSGWYEVSLRGTSAVKIHLGKITGEIAGKYGGNGGGHKVAAGCSIPKGRVMDVLRELNKRL